MFDEVIKIPDPSYALLAKPSRIVQLNTAVKVPCTAVGTVPGMVASVQIENTSCLNFYLRNYLDTPDESILNMAQLDPGSTQHKENYRKIVNIFHNRQFYRFRFFKKLVGGL